MINKFTNLLREILFNFKLSSTDPIAWNELYISSNSHEEEEEEEEERKAMKGCEFTASFKCIAPYE